MPRKRYTNCLTARTAVQMAHFVLQCTLKKKCTLFPAAVANYRRQRGQIDDCDGSLSLTKMHLHIEPHSSVWSGALFELHAPACLPPVRRVAGVSPLRMQCRKFEVVYGCCHLGALREGNLERGHLPAA